MHVDPDLVAKCLAGQCVGPINPPRLLETDARSVLLHVNSQCVVNIHFECFEPVRVRLQPLGPVAPLFLAQVVAAGCVRVEQNLVPEVAAEQLRHRLIEDLTRQVPQRHVDSARHFHLAPALGIRIKHVVEMHLDGEWILAGQSEVGQTAGAVVARNHGPGDRAGGIALAVPRQTGVRIDADERLPSFELKRLDPGDLAETLRGRRQRPIMREGNADRHGQRRLEEVASCDPHSHSRAGQDAPLQLAISSLCACLLLPGRR